MATATKMEKLTRAFHDLIERADVVACEKLYKQHNLNVDIPMGKERFSPLHKACYYGHLECVHWLVWHSANINTKSMQGWTPAHIAAIKGKEQCMEALITHRADLNIQDEAGQCPIHLAAAHSNMFTLRVMCRKGADIDLRDINGWKPIHHAAHNGDLGCLQTLVKWGADLETVTMVTGDTALHLATAQGHLTIVKFIICNVEDWVAAMACINNDAETPLERALLFDHGHVIEYLSNLQINEVNEVDEGYPLHVAASLGDIGELQRIVGSGLYTVDTRDEQQSTPAHKAAGHGQVEALRWLINNGCNLDLFNPAGETAKDVAKRFGKVACVDLLGGYSEDEEEIQSPEELLEQAVNKVDELEVELNQAKRAVQHLGGTPLPSPPADPNAMLSETQELKELLEYERCKREKMEATIDRLRKQVEKQCKEETLRTPPSSDSSLSSVSVKAKTRRPRKVAKQPITRGVFIKNLQR